MYIRSVAPCVIRPRTAQSSFPNLQARGRASEVGFSTLRTVRYGQPAADTVVYAAYPSQLARLSSSPARHAQVPYSAWQLAFAEAVVG